LPRAGLSKFDTSKEPPEAEPAPMIVWISSINNIAFSFVSKNFKTSLSLFSKSPLYLVPAIKAAISNE
jgi:hypothetical protein